MSTEGAQYVAGERHPTWTHQFLSPHARLNNRLAMLLAGGLGLAILGSYYWHLAHRAQSPAQREWGRAQPPTEAVSEPDFSSLPTVSMTAAPVPPEKTGRVALAEAESAPTGPPDWVPMPAPAPANAVPVRASSLDRRLSGDAYAAASGGSASAPAASLQAAATDGSSAGPEPALAAQGSAAGDLASRGSSIVRASARLLTDQRLLLPRGAFIDCTLETAIDSSLPGMTTCITATDTFGTDGKVVLLERGSKLTGETRGQVQQGMARIFVLWSEARTPAGVIVPLDSPATDALGRAGLDGSVDRHFWQRFGAALLISTIDAGTEVALQSAGRGGGTVVYSPTATGQVATETLKGTLDIAPTIRKHNGDRIQVLVARDIDFRPVYELRNAGIAP